MDLLRAPLKSGVAIRLALRGWRWWTAQLLQCLPPGLRRFLRPRHRRLIVYPGQAGFELWLEHNGGLRPLPRSVTGDPLAAIPPRLRYRNAERCLLVPAAAVLYRRVRLPRAARGHAREVLSFEIDRYTPLGADEAYFDCCEIPGEDDDESFALDLHVVRRGVVDPWLSEMEAFGTPATAVDVEAPGPCDGPVCGLGLDLLPPQSRPPGSRATRAANLALSVLAVILAVAVVEYPLLQRMSLADRLEAEIAELRREAAGIEALRLELQEAQQSALEIRNRRRSRPLASDLLLDVTQRLPDSVWLESIALGSGRIDLYGQAESASPLINLLESSPWLREVSFRAPVTHNPQTTSEWFRIDARLVGHDQAD